MYKSYLNKKIFLCLNKHLYLQLNTKIMNKKQGRPKKPHIEKVSTMSLSVPNRHRAELKKIFKKIINDYREGQGVSTQK